jgi:hypothetical protein
MDHLNDEQLILHFYGDADAPAAIEAHLRECADCRKKLETLKSVLAAVGMSPTMKPAERPANYEAEVWKRLEPRLTETKHGSWWSVDLAAWFRPQRLAMAGAMAVLLIGVFYLGWVMRGIPGTPGVTNVTDNGTVRERILLVAVGEHLERSQMVLLELSNAPSNGTVDISAEQRRARDLVDENRLYRKTALSTGDPGLANVLDQLERVLVEIANSPNKVSSQELAGIRKRLESQGILFKLRVVESEVKQRAMPQNAAPAADRKTI